MHDPRAARLRRLDAIASSLARRPGTLALLGVGSAGVETHRLDEYSDLDFFVIAEHDCVAPLIDSLDWLEEAGPIAFAFQNTPDGSKVLFADGIYGEFAVFDLETLRSIPFHGARVVWQREGLDLSDALAPGSAPPDVPTAEWLLCELLTNLYVGLTRLRRGEALSAERLIQVHAVNRLLDLLPSIEAPSGHSRDPFDSSRRAELRFPRTAPAFSRFMQGYDRSPESALALLRLVSERFDVNPTLARRITELADEAIAHR